MGQRLMTHWPTQKCDPFDPSTYDPSTHCQLCMECVQNKSVHCRVSMYTQSGAYLVKLA